MYLKYKCQWYHSSCFVLYRRCKDCFATSSSNKNSYNSSNNYRIQQPPEPTAAQFPQLRALRALASTVAPVCLRCTSTLSAAVRRTTRTASRDWSSRSLSGRRCRSSSRLRLRLPSGRLPQPQRPRRLLRPAISKCARRTRRFSRSRRTQWRLSSGALFRGPLQIAVASRRRPLQTPQWRSWLRFRPPVDRQTLLFPKRLSQRAPRAIRRRLRPAPGPGRPAGAPRVRPGREVGLGPPKPRLPRALLTRRAGATNGALVRPARRAEDDAVRKCPRSAVGRAAKGTTMAWPGSPVRPQQRRKLTTATLKIIHITGFRGFASAGSSAWNRANSPEVHGHLARPRVQLHIFTTDSPHVLYSIISGWLLFDAILPHEVLLLYYCTVHFFHLSPLIFSTFELNNLYINKVYSFITFISIKYRSFLHWFKHGIHITTVLIGIAVAEIGEFSVLDDRTRRLGDEMEKSPPNAMCDWLFTLQSRISEWIMHCFICLVYCI